MILWRRLRLPGFAWAAGRPWRDLCLLQLPAETRAPRRAITQSGPSPLFAAVRRRLSADLSNYSPKTRLGPMRLPLQPPGPVMPVQPMPASTSAADANLLPCALRPLTRRSTVADAPPGTPGQQGRPEEIEHIIGVSNRRQTICD